MRTAAYIASVKTQILKFEFDREIELRIAELEKEVFDTRGALNRHSAISPPETKRSQNYR